MTDIQKKLKLETLKQRRKDIRLVLFYKGLKGNASKPCDPLKAPLRHTRNQHPFTFQLP